MAAQEVLGYYISEVRRLEGQKKMQEKLIEGHIKNKWRKRVARLSGNAIDSKKTFYFGLRTMLHAELGGSKKGDDTSMEAARSLA